MNKYKNANKLLIIVLTTIIIITINEEDAGGITRGIFIKSKFSILKFPGIKNEISKIQSICMVNVFFYLF